MQDGFAPEIIRGVYTDYLECVLFALEIVFDPGTEKGLALLSSERIIETISTARRETVDRRCCIGNSLRKMEGLPLRRTFPRRVYAFA